MQMKSYADVLRRVGAGEQLEHDERAGVDERVERPPAVRREGEGPEGLVADARPRTELSGPAPDLGRGTYVKIKSLGGVNM